MTNKNQIEHIHVINLKEQEKFQTARKEIARPLTIKSAVDLSSDQISRIVQAVQKITQEEFTQVYLMIDETLLMGVSVHSDSFYYELSGQKMLEELSRVMHES